MRMFEHDEHVNFIDSKDRFVGYEFGQCCCELVGWSITRTLPEDGADEVPNPIADFDLAGYDFDPDFFAEIVDAGEGGFAVFRLRKADDEVYLVIYNHHNGYYSHGFTARVGGVVPSEGSL